MPNGAPICRFAMARAHAINVDRITACTPLTFLRTYDECEATTDLNRNAPAEVDLPARLGKTTALTLRRIRVVLQLLDLLLDAILLTLQPLTLLNCEPAICSRLLRVGSDQLLVPLDLSHLLPG